MSENRTRRYLVLSVFTAFIAVTFGFVIASDDRQESEGISSSFFSFCLESGLPSVVDREGTVNYFNCESESDYVVEVVLEYIPDDAIAGYVFPSQRLKNSESSFFLYADRIERQKRGNLEIIEPICELCNQRYVHYSDDFIDLFLSCSRDGIYPNPLCEGNIFFYEHNTSTYVRFPAAGSGAWQLIANRISAFLDSSRQD